MLDDSDIGCKKTEVVRGVTRDARDRRRFEGSGAEKEKGLGEAALFLDKVSTKFDFTDRATVDNVAWRRRVFSVGEGVEVRPVEDVERSALRCSMVVVVCLGTSVAVACRNMVGG
jgi:hypothetical protein